MNFFKKILGSAAGVKGVSYADYRDKLHGEDVLLIDVRSAEEFATGHLPEAMNLPLDQIEKRADELPKSKNIATICAHGIRSMTAAKQLAAKGFNVVSVDGGNAAVPAADKVK